MTSPAPEPQEWLSAYAKVQQLADRELLALLRKALQDLNLMLRELDARAKAGRATFSDAVRREQLQTVKRTLLRSQAEIFAKLGNIIAQRRVEAAERAVVLGGRIDQLLFDFAGQGETGQALLRALTEGLNRTVEVVTTRITQSQFPLSQRVYRTRLWLDDRIQAKVNSALARGLTAQEFAREARDWISPYTPGGVRYAALRLARSEINNAYHAIAVNNSAEKPWVSGQKWHLSRSHPKADECDDYAKTDKFGLGEGVFPRTDVPRKPHPQCFCYITPEVLDEDAFLDNLVAGHYDEYLEAHLR